jgi:hypothetical protein
VTMEDDDMQEILETQLRLQQEAIQIYEEKMKRKRELILKKEEVLQETHTHTHTQRERERERERETTAPFNNSSNSRSNEFNHIHTLKHVMYVSIANSTQSQSPSLRSCRKSDWHVKKSYKSQKAVRFDHVDQRFRPMMVMRCQPT